MQLRILRSSDDDEGIAKDFQDGAIRITRPMHRSGRTNRNICGVDYRAVYRG